MYFSGDIVDNSELEERKKFRHHPLTGTFHSLPGYYDPLHRLSEYRTMDDGLYSDTASMRSFVAMDITDSEDNMDTSSVVSQPMNSLFVAYRQRRFSDADAETFFDQATTEAPGNQKIEDVPCEDKSVDDLAVHSHSNQISPSNRAAKRISRGRKSSVTSNPGDKGMSKLEVVSQASPIPRSMSTSDLSDGFISTGKGIFRKVGYRMSHHGRIGDKEYLKPLSTYPGDDGSSEDECHEYTQAAPRIPLNPFIARRLTDGEEIRIMAIHRSARRDSVPHVINPGSDEEDEYSQYPKPYFIHEKAVTEQYELVGEDQLGDGSYAVVKPAIRRDNRKEVAIKQIHKRYLRTEDAKQAVDREIEIHLRLKHKHIVRLHEVYETPDFLYLVMAKATKGNLKALMQRKRRLPEALAAKLGQQIVRAVFFLHDSGVLHCDLKPENILLSDAKTSNQESNDGHSPKARQSSPKNALDPHADVKVCDLQVELCDFGLSVKVPDVRFYKLTGDVHKVPFTGVTGTPGYIAPELLQQQPYGKPVDMWSVGIVIYEMLTGYQPFYPPHACIDEEADFNDRIWKSISAPAKELVMGLLERDPTKRFTAADALSHSWFDTATFAI